jgi:hypothetical protein
VQTFCSSLLEHAASAHGTLPLSHPPTPTHHSSRHQRAHEHPKTQPLCTLETRPHLTYSSTPGRRAQEQRGAKAEGRARISHPSATLNNILALGAAPRSMDHSQGCCRRRPCVAGMGTRSWRSAALSRHLQLSPPPALSPQIKTAGLIKDASHHFSTENPPVIKPLPLTCRTSD